MQKRRQSRTNKGGGRPTSGYSFLVAAFSFFFVAIIFFLSANINYKFSFKRFLFFLVLCAVSASFELLWFTYFSLSFVLETFHKCLVTG